MIKYGFPDPIYTPLHISAILNKQKKEFWFEK